MRVRHQWERDVGPHGTRRRVRALCRRLEKTHGPFVPKVSRAPLDGLIMTVLSQATNDRSSDRAFSRLKDRFPTWRQVLEAPLELVEEAIRPGGLSRSKARTIHSILEVLEARAQGLPPETKDPLSHLSEATVEDAMAELTALPGVGLKTAACVLLFCCHRPVMPVDTHVHRVSRRLGLVRDKATADQTHHVLMAITPGELVYSFHLWLIAHGRGRCHALRPLCGGCPLFNLCPTGVARQ